MLRHLLASAVLGSALFSLGGCTVPVVGATGVGVDTRLRPVGYLAVCHDRIDGAFLHHDGEGDSRSDAEWTAATPVDGVASWPFDGDSSSAWRRTGTLVNLQPGRRYVLYGGTHDNTSSTSAVDFTLSDLAALVPGQVRWVSTTSRSDDTTAYRVGSVDDFVEDTCRRQA